MDDDSQDQEEEDHDKSFQCNDTPKVAMVGSLEQILHFALCFNHVFFSVIHWCPQFSYFSILLFDRGAEALSLVLCRLYDSYDLSELSIWFFKHFFLKAEDPSIVEVACLVEFFVLTTSEVFCLVLW